MLALVEDGERHVAETLGGLGISLRAVARSESRTRGLPARRRPREHRPRCGRRPGRSARRRTRGRRTAAGSRRVGSRRALALAQQLDERRHDRVQVADDGKVAELEDGRARILVDRDDHLRVLHADLVLHGAGDTQRDVELRRDGLPGLADLRRVRVPALVHDRAGRADRAAEDLGEGLGEREALRRRRGRCRRRRSLPRLRSRAPRSPGALGSRSSRRANGPVAPR